MIGTFAVNTGTVIDAAATLAAYVDLTRLKMRRDELRVLKAAAAIKWVDRPWWRRNQPPPNEADIEAEFDRGVPFYFAGTKPHYFPQKYATWGDSMRKDADRLMDLSFAAQASDADTVTLTDEVAYVIKSAGWYSYEVKRLEKELADEPV